MIRLVSDLVDFTEELSKGKDIGANQSKLLIAHEENKINQPNRGVAESIYGTYS